MTANLGLWSSESFADLSCRQCARKAHASRILANLVYSRQKLDCLAPVEPRGRNLSLPQTGKQFGDTLYSWCCLHSQHIFSKTGFIGTDYLEYIARMCVVPLALDMHDCHALSPSFKGNGLLCSRRLPMRCPASIQNHIVKQELNRLWWLKHGLYVVGRSCHGIHRYDILMICSWF